MIHFLHHLKSLAMSEKKPPFDDSVQVATDAEPDPKLIKAEANNGSDGSNTRPGSSRVKMVSKRDIDDTTLFYNTHKDSVKPIDDTGIKRLNQKNFWFLLSQTWWIAFLIHLDKSTLSQASTMGIFKDVQMTKNEYNDLFVVFYTGYLIALWPGAYIAQRVGHKYFITVSLLLWALLLGMHPLAKTGKQMIGLRFLLGMVSGKLDSGIKVLEVLIVVDRVANRSIYDCSSPGLLSTQEESLGPVAVVGIRQFRKRPPHHGRLQTHPG